MRRSNLVCAALLAIAVSCVEPIVMDPMEEMPVVVNCVLTRDGGRLGEVHPEDNRNYQPPMQYLDLYYARTPSQDGYKTIDAAKVNVSGNGESHDFVWNGSRWECAFLPRFNVVYKLSIETGDGHELSSVMTFPPDCRLRRYRLIEHRSLNYFGNTFAGYYYLQKHYDTREGCRFENFRDECFMWVRALENGVPVRKICTNHPGVDDFNVRRDVWGDCAVIDYYAAQFKAFAENENARYATYNAEDYTNVIGYTPPIYVNPELWDRFAQAWLSSPLHDVFLRIHHPADFDNGMHKPWDYYVANDFGDRQPADPRDLFVLGADFDPSPKVIGYTDDEGNVDESTLPWNYLDKYEIRFVSESYDRYLRSSVERKGIRGDEFSLSYSADPMYSNIKGGLGCFGGQWITAIEISTGY